MAAFNLFPSQQPLTGIAGLLFGNGRQTGLGGFLQQAQSAGSMALMPTATPPREPWDERPAQLPSDMPAPQRAKPTGIARILGAIGDGLAAVGGQQPLFYQAQQKAAEDEANQRATIQKILTEYQLNRAGHAADRQVDIANPEPSGTQKDWIYRSGLTPEQQQQFDAFNAIRAGGMATDASGAPGYYTTAPGGAGMAAPKTQADWQALPPGTPYIAPDGSYRVKPGGAGQSGPQTFR